MNGALVNAIAGALEANWLGGTPLGDAGAAAEAVADFVAALPFDYTAADVLAAIRGEDGAS